MDRQVGFALLAAAAVFAAVGLLALTGALHWFGRLPGDVRFGSGSTRVYVPVTTMILVSVVLSAVGWVLRRWL